MKAKKRYTLEEHDKLGLELQTIYDRLGAIKEDLSIHYPVTVYAEATHMAREAINNLRSKMDNEILKELMNVHDPEYLKRIYYRAGRPDHDPHPKPILPLRTVNP